MSSRHRRNSSPSLIWFFLKTLFFHPRSNPIFVVLFFFVACFSLEGSLDKYHLALIMYLTVLAHSSLGGLVKVSPGPRGDSGPAAMTRFLKTMPVEGKKIYFCYLSSAGIYALLVYLVLGLLLIKMMRLPDLRDMQFVTSVAPDGDTMTTVTGYAFTPRGIPYFVSLDWERSLLFDAMGSTGGGTVWMSGYLIIVFLYISVLNVHRDFRPGRWLRPSNLFHTLPLVLFSCGGVVLLAELILTQNEMGAASRYFLQHINTATMAFLLATAITLIAVVTMSTAVVKELQKR